jgi:DNA replication protein DnaC
MIKDDEYINKNDGLIYCKECKTPRQYRLQPERLVYIRCKCQQEVYNREQAEIERREKARRIANLRYEGLPDRTLLGCTFANSKGTISETEKVKAYVEKWEQLYKKSLGLLLWGDVSSGKTFYAACIANALINKEIPVYMTNFSRILNQLTNGFSDNRNEYIDSLNKYKLLIIDDLGIERKSEFAMEQVFNIIDSRYRSNKPMIITTNLTLDEIKNPSDTMQKRIYSRIIERCMPVKISSNNFREVNRKNNLEEIRNIFNGNE